MAFLKYSCPRDLEQVRELEKILKAFGLRRVWGTPVAIHGRHGFGYRVAVIEIEPKKEKGVEYRWVTVWEGIPDKLFLILERRLWKAPLLLGEVPPKVKK